MTSVPRNRPHKTGFLRCGTAMLPYTDKPRFTRQQLAVKARKLYRDLRSADIDGFLTAKSFTRYMLHCWGEHYN